MNKFLVQNGDNNIISFLSKILEVSTFPEKKKIFVKSQSDTMQTHPYPRMLYFCFSQPECYQYNGLTILHLF